MFMKKNKINLIELRTKLQRQQIKRIGMGHNILNSRSICLPKQDVALCGLNLIHFLEDTELEAPK
jgi:hypothetical protein